MRFQTSRAFSPLTSDDCSALLSSSAARVCRATSPSGTDEVACLRTDGGHSTITLPDAQGPALDRHCFQVDCARYRRAGQAVWKRAIIGRWETSSSPQPRTTSSPLTTRADSSTNSEQSREIVSYWMSWQREPPVPCWTSAAGLATSGLAFDRPVDMSSRSISAASVPSRASFTAPSSKSVGL